ncbi:Panacea domain-containing protein [Peribacillus sp. NPDC101480]|uniref:Panacea domain-containing protein n=1 Tax=Peribacillus sp. NPDC101480 TaxID=3390620 RepID=UPI003CFD7C03
MPQNVIDISKWFIQNNFDVSRRSFNGHVKLQKLLYYSQAMNLAVKDEILFNNEIQAWENGPVVNSIFREYEHNDLIEDTFNKQEFDYSSVFDGKTLNILQTVNYIYGNHTGDQLIELTHSEDPWKELEDEANMRLNPEIEVDRIRDYYSGLKDLFDLYEDYDFSSDSKKEINGNVFVYNRNETMLSRQDIDSLREIGNQIKGEKYFVSKDEENELVVF